MRKPSPRTRPCLEKMETRSLMSGSTPVVTTGELRFVAAQVDRTVINLARSADAPPTPCLQATRFRRVGDP